MISASASVDTRAAVAMFRALANLGPFTSEVLAAAEAGVASASGVHPDAEPLVATEGRNPSTNRNSALIVSDSPRAAFIFARYPPSIPTGALAGQLADAVAQRIASAW